MDMGRIILMLHELLSQRIQVILITEGFQRGSVIIDNNDLQIDGSLEEVNSPYPIDEKLKAFGFEVKVIDGHDFNEIKEAFDAFEKGAEKPFAIIAKTTKGKGVSFMENKCDWHGVAPNEEQYKMAMAELEGGEI